MSQTQTTIAPEEIVANVQSVLVRFARRVIEYHGRTMADARRAVERCRTHRVGRRGWLRRQEWYSDAWAAVSALDHWRELKRLHAAGKLTPLVVDDDMPF